MPAQHFTKEDFEEKVLKADKPAVIDFYAVWCGPCQMAAPVIDTLAEEYEGKVVIGKVDVDQSQELAEKYGIMSIPTMVVFKNGQEVDRKIGFPGETGLRRVIDEAAK